MEPRWTQLPPAPSNLPHLPLERAPAGAHFQRLITSDTILGVWTHFMGGRTLACITEECPGCQSNLPRRWEGYLACVTPKPHRHIILALTPGAAIGIHDSAPSPDRLRGLLLVCERFGKRANARLRARVEPVELGQHPLPPAPDLKAHLLHIWGLDQAHACTDNPGYSGRIKELFKRNGNSADEKPVP
jgi:hypothetical protein